MTVTSAAAKSYITKLADAHPNEAIRKEYAQLKDQHEKKLWHQVTLKLEHLVTNPYFDTNTELIDLYEHFIKEFETKINQLKFVKIILSIVREVKDPQQSISFLQHVSGKINGSVDKEAYCLTLTELALLHLKVQQFEVSKELTDKAAAILDTIAGADPLVYSSYYRVLSIYFKVKVAPTEFYRNSLLYLVYTPVENIPVAEQQSLAFDMGIAALISTDIYNFGELLAHPVLKSLDGTKSEWLNQFLYAFNSGDLNKYDAILTSHRTEIEAQAALKANLVLLREKISILALMELVFNRTAEERTIPFQVIADATKIQVDEVELLIMKALSLKLIKGVIDELTSTVAVNWVQPRVLDLNQVKKMRDRVNKWTDSVTQVLRFVENETAPELLA